MSDARYSIIPYGPRALLIRSSGTMAPIAHALVLEPSKRARALASALRRLSFITEVVVAYDEVLVTFRDSAQSATVVFEIEQAVSELQRSKTSHESSPPREHHVGVRYDGVDLATVAQQKCMTVDQLVALHASVDYQVLAVGFQPGFAYLGELPEAIRLPRRAEPRPRVPAGSVAIAGPHTAVYPHVSPGGWHLIGRVVLPHASFDIDRESVARVGESVRFCPITSI